MLKNLIGTMFCALLLNCNPESDVTTSGAEVPLTDVLTFEFSFGDDESVEPSDFLLVYMLSIAVNQEGHLLVLDEDRIKVYDENGNPLRIVGRKGLGPGEFDYASKLTIGPMGIISVLDQFGYSRLTPDYKLIEKVNFRNSELNDKIIAENNWDNVNLTDFISLDDTHHLLKVNSIIDRTQFKIISFESILQINGSEIETLYKDLVPYLYGHRSPERRSSFFTFPLTNLGILSWALLPENKFVYILTGGEIADGEGTWNYTLTVKSLETGKEFYISHPYFPMEVTLDNLNRYDGRVKANSHLPSMKDAVGQLKEIMKDKKYNSPVLKLIADGQYIFVMSNRKNDNNELFTDVFNTDTGAYVSSLYLLENPHLIHNGYVYYFVYAKEDEFTRIEKYKIDPAVYGNRVLQNPKTP